MTSSGSARKTIRNSPSSPPKTWATVAGPTRQRTPTQASSSTHSGKRSTSSARTRRTHRSGTSGRAAMATDCHRVGTARTSSALRSRPETRGDRRAYRVIRSRARLRTVAVERTCLMDGPRQAWWAERVLVERLSCGDETALHDLYDRYAGFVYGLAVRTLVDAQAAEDVTQEVFVSLWEHPERID